MVRGVCRVVRLAADARGEDVDVLLDALVRVVDRPSRELAAEVRIVAEPVVNEATAQPDSPTHDEPLRQVQVRQRPRHIANGKNRENKDRRPKSVYASVSRRTGLESDLQRREQIVGVIAEKDVDANNEDRRQQQQPDHCPHRRALPALEIVTSDAPELAPPLGRPLDHHEHHEQARSGDHPHLQHPQRRVEEFVAPVDRRSESVHPATPPSGVANLRRSYRRSWADGTCTRLLGECCAQMPHEGIDVDARRRQRQIAVGTHHIRRGACGRIHLSEIAIPVVNQRQHGAGHIGIGRRNQIDIDAPVCGLDGGVRRVLE